MEESLQENDEIKTCPLCPMKVAFTDVESLKAHIELCQKDRPYRCEQCGLGFRDVGSLAEHEKIHNRGPRSFSCSVCEKKFHSKQTLLRHDRVHQKPKFICAECGRAFRYKQGFAAHCLRHLGVKTESPKVFLSTSANHQYQVSHNSH